MAGSKGAHGPRRFISHLRMKCALGIPLSHRMFAKQMHGRDRRRGTWWDRELNRIAIEGIDFAQDTQEGGAERFELIPDSDEEEGAKGSSLVGDDDEYVPETEPQDLVTVSKIAEPCAKKGPGPLGTMLHQWLESIREQEQEQEQEKEISKANMESNNMQMHNVKLEMDSVKLEVDSVKLEVDSANVEMENDKLDMPCGKVQMDASKEEVDHKASFSDLETGDEGCWFQDSQMEDDDFDDFDDQVIDTSTLTRVFEDVLKRCKR